MAKLDIVFSLSIVALLSACSTETAGTDAPVGVATVDSAFLNGTWVSGCDAIGTTSAKYCTTFSGNNSYASRTMFFAASTTCNGASNVISGAGTYTLAGPATSPSGATNVDVVINGFGMRFSILARDGAKLKVGKEDATHDGSVLAQRYVAYMIEAHSKAACPF